MKRREALSPSLGLMATVTVLMLATLLLFYLVTGSAGRQKSMQVISDVHKTVVIDAGHGGIDGGAVAPDGTLEKHINLEIARILSALLRVSGYETVMTRESDVMLGTEGGTGSAKMRDLKQRLMIAGSYQGALTVSIHCNKFPLEKCKGMQVYYSASPVAEQTARAVQNEFLRLDSTCVRQVKKADSSIYLLYRAVSPTILVECGFLSNGEELEKLKTEEYKKKLALTVMSGIDASFGAL